MKHECRACGNEFNGHPAKRYCSDRCRWRNKTQRYRIRAMVREAFSTAIRRGELKRPKECSKCGDEPQQTIQGHHPNYDKPLYVEWLCEKCHRELHCPNWGKRA